MSNNNEVNNNSSKKGRLGRGLGSLLVEHSTVETAEPKAAASAPTPAVDKVEIRHAPINEEAQIWQIAIEKVIPNPTQPRKTFDPIHLKELSDSIKQKGILQPITARKNDLGKYEIIAGERRWRAAQMAGLHEVPVILKKTNDQDSFELAIIENIQRANLNPMEEAEAYDQLLQKYSLTQQEVSLRVGKDRATIANSLRMLSLPAPIKQMLRNQEISMGHAKAILAVDDIEQQVQIAKVVVSEKLSVRATEKLAAQSKFRQSPVAESAQAIAKQQLTQRLTKQVEEDLQKILGTKVSVDYTQGKGKISISFYSDEQFNSQVDKLKAAWNK